MPPALKKWGAYWFRLVRVCVCVCLCVHTCVGPRKHSKGGITPEEDHGDLTTSWKIEGRSENVVKIKPFQVYKIILRPYHVLTTFAPRPCQVLTTAIRFPMSSYHALTTLTPFIVRSYYVLNTTKQTTLRAYHAFSTF